MVIHLLFQSFSPLRIGIIRNIYLYRPLTHIEHKNYKRLYAEITKARNGIFATLTQIIVIDIIWTHLCPRLFKIIHHLNSFRQFFLSLQSISHRLYLISLLCLLHWASTKAPTRVNVRLKYIHIYSNIRKTEILTAWQVYEIFLSFLYKRMFKSENFSQRKKCSHTLNTCPVNARFFPSNF